MRLLLLLLLLPSVTALTPLDAGTMEARVLIMNDVSFSVNGRLYTVQDATGRLSWFPRKDALQQVLTLTTTPEGEQREDAITFSWRRPSVREQVQVESTIRTRNAAVPVRERIPFPIASVPEGTRQYLGTGEIIDQNGEIKRLAQELAGRKNDLYEVVYTLADWTTTHVEYSLASLRAPAIQTSSEVLQSRWGKCDELTALFISLNRALGIPARFVAGYSYTNSNLLSSDWGGHGWAEVWFPKVGWVPFDVTYGEYGYLDAGHVKLKVAPDAKESSIEYAASGRDFTLETTPLDIFITPTEMTAMDDDRLEITLDTPYRSVGFGSAVLVLAQVTNLQDYYVATRLNLAHTSNTEMLSDTYKNVLLRPHGTVTVPFLIRIDAGLDSGYRYEFPFRLSSRLGTEDTITINVNPNAPVYTEEQLRHLAASYTNPSAGSPFSVTCTAELPGYPRQEILQICSTEGVRGDSITICGGTCSLLPLENGTFILNTTHESPGVYTEKRTARYLGRDVPFFITTEVVAPTEVEISVEAPRTVRMDEEVPLTIMLDATGADPTMAVVTTTAGRATLRQNVSRFPARITARLPGRALRSGRNRIEARVSWENELGTRGAVSASAEISLTDADLVHRLTFWLADLGDLLSFLGT